MATYEETLYDKGYPPFYPENYGTVDGIPAHDTAAVQGAINAAVVAGGGRVICNGTYELQSSGTLDSAIAPCTYALWVDGDNVSIEGAGTLELNAGAVPGGGNFVAVLFGNGGSTGAQGRPGNTGTWRYNNYIQNVHINGTALTAAQRRAISTNHTSAVVNFLYCQDFLAQGVTITDGWGGNCALGSQASSRNGRVDNCRIEGMVTGTGHGAFAFWFDGAQNVILENSYTTTGCAFTFQSNMDNCRGEDRTGLAKDCIARNNTFTNLGDVQGRMATACTGASNILVEGNSFTVATGQWIGNLIQVFDTDLNAAGHSDGVVFRNNTFVSANNSQWAFYLKGVSDDPYTAGVDPVYIEDFCFQGNTLTGYTYKGWFYNQYCRNATVSGNTYNGNPATYGYTSAGDEAFIVANNTLQGWSETFFDDFTGDALDATKWTAREGGYDPEYHLPANVTVADSLMTITAKHEDYGGLHYTSGMVHTKNKVSWRYGLFEARMKIPYGPTLVPSIFMVPTIMPDEEWGFDPDRTYGEIDLMEYFPTPLGSNTSTRGALCYGSPAYADWTTYDTGIDLSADYHIWSLKWESGKFCWYIDSTLFKTATTWYSSTGSFPHPFDDQFFLIFLFNAGTSGENPVPDPYPASMLVDWVKVFEAV